MKKSFDRQSLEEQAALVSRYVAGELSRSERAEFEAWLVASPELAAEVDMERRLRRNIVSAARRGWLSRSSSGPSPGRRWWRMAIGSLLVPIIALLGSFLLDAKRAHSVDLSASFSAFVNKSAGMADAPRIAAFQTQMDALLPGFYVPRFGATPENYKARIADALKEFAALRPKYEQVPAGFPRRVRRRYPAFSQGLPDSRRTSLSIYCTRSARWTAARARLAARPI